MGKYFIAVYTNECKKYADERFFKSLGLLTGKNHELWIADNSLGPDYYNRLSKKVPQWYGEKPFTLHHIDVSREDKSTLFLRNVTESLTWLREQFLMTDAEYFVIFESDVIMPPATLEMFAEVADQADIIGGIYYKGFHEKALWNADNKALVQTNHVLSGCTLYKREVIKNIPFRWSTDDIKAFPDAWICFDSRGKYRMANYCKIKCRHLEKRWVRTRGKESLK